MIHPWPASLPQDCLIGSSITPQAGLLDPEEERTPQRTRTEPEQEAIFTIHCTAAQLATFRSFYATDLNGGCACFTLPWLEVLGFDHHFVRLTAGPSWQMSGMYRAVSLPVEIIASAAWPEGV